MLNLNAPTQDSATWPDMHSEKVISEAKPMEGENYLGRESEANMADPVYWCHD